MLPPTRDVGDFLILVREPESPTIVIVLANKDSYEADAEETEQYLRLLGCPDDLGAVDYVWNFYACMINLVNKIMQPISYEQAQQFMKGEVA